MSIMGLGVRRRNAIESFSQIARVDGAVVLVFHRASLKLLVEMQLGAWMC